MTVTTTPPDLSPTPTSPYGDRSVDDVMGQVLSELAASLGVLLTELGLRTGIWAAMRGAGPLAVEDLAMRAGVRTALVQEWARSQAAAGYLTYDPHTDRYALPEAVAVALLDAPGGATVGACTEMMQSMLATFDEFAEAFARDGSFAWHQRDLRHWHGTDRLTRAQLPAALIGAAVDQMSGIRPMLDAGGTVLDVGCGFGFPTRSVATHFPAAIVVGVDYHQRSVEAASRFAQDEGLTDRVSFHVASATDLPGTGYALITFFDSLHDFGEPAAALRAARSALAPGGAVLVCDNDAADSVADNLNPLGRMYYAVSTLICTPNALSQQGPDSPPPLGTYAGQARIGEVAQQAGFSRISRLEVPGALNLFLDLRP
jgi:SAM-dependent methyltransferase